MASRDPSDHDVVDPLADDPLAFLYEPGDEDEDNPPPEHPGYGSLMGLKVGARKTGKAMAIVLDDHEAQRAAEVMEINAGQLMTNPDRSNRQFGFQNLGLDAGEEEEDEGDLAETLSWDAEEADEDSAGWQPENPLAGTGIAEEEDDADWQPENPLAGTGYEHVHADDEWAEPAAPSGEPAYEDEQAWSAAAAAPAEPEYQEVEWETPPAATEEPEEPADAAQFPHLAEPESAEAEDPAEQPTPVAWQLPPDDAAPAGPSVSAPISWQSLASKRPPKKQVDLTPIDWQELPEEAAPVAEDIPAEPAPPADDGWPDTGAEPFELPAEPPPIWQAFAAQDATADAGGQASEIAAAEPGESAEAPASPVEAEWEGFAEEPAAPYTSEWEPIAQPEPADFSTEAEPVPEPEEIEILRFPAPPAVAPEPEVPHHRLRAKVMKTHQERTTQPSRLKPVLQWLGARFNEHVLPLLKQLLAWAKAKWAEIAARARRD